MDIMLKVISHLKSFGDIKAPKYLLSNTGLEEADFSIKLGKNKIISGWEAIYSRVCQ